MTECPLIRLRRQRGFKTRLSFAQKLPLSLETVKLHELGLRRKMKLTTAAKFSRVLNVPSEELIAEYAAWKDDLSS